MVTALLTGLGFCLLGGLFLMSAFVWTTFGADSYAYIRRKMQPPMKVSAETDPESSSARMLRISQYWGEA